MSDKYIDTTVDSTMTTGAPAPSDRSSLTIGPNGPVVLHDVHFLEQMAHFNREKVIERQPHAKGSGAFGVLDVTEDVSAWTKAALFQKGTRTDMLARFSTVAGEQGSPDTWRDVRGFSLKFYTTQGNYDLVGNNTPIFFVRDPIGTMVRAAYTLRADDDDFSQPGILVRKVFNDDQRAKLVDQVAGSLLGGVREPVLSRAFDYWKSVDAATGQRIEDKVRSGNAPEPAEGMGEGG